MLAFCRSIITSLSDTSGAQNAATADGALQLGGEAVGLGHGLAGGQVAGFGLGDGHAHLLEHALDAGQA